MAQSLSQWLGFRPTAWHRLLWGLGPLEKVLVEPGSRRSSGFLVLSCVPRQAAPRVFFPLHLLGPWVYAHCFGPWLTMTLISLAWHRYPHGPSCNHARLDLMFVVSNCSLGIASWHWTKLVTLYIYICKILGYSETETHFAWQSMTHICPWVKTSVSWSLS